jgi:hypothetical protein
MQYLKTRKLLTDLFNRRIEDSMVSESNIDERYNKWEVKKRTKWSKKVRNRRKTIRGQWWRRKPPDRF